MGQKFEEKIPEVGKRGYLRYILAGLLFCGVGLNYIIKVMLSVAIVAMVKEQKNSDSSNDTGVSIADTCPGGSTGSSGDDERGTYDWDEEIQGEILASYFYGYVATQFIGGWTSDKFGGRWVLGVGVVLTGVVSLICPVAAELDPVAFMVLRALQGACSGVILPSTTVMLSKWFTLKERPRIAGIVLSANYAGTLVSMGLSGVLIEALDDWAAVFYVFGGACIAFGLPWFFFAYNNPDVHPRIGDWERRHIFNGLQVDTGKTEQEKQKEIEDQQAMPVPWRSILTSAPFWAAVAMHTGSTWLNYTLMTELPTYSKKMLHYNIKDSGFISALPYLFAWIASSLFGTLSSWLRNRGYVSQITAYRIFNGIGSIGPAIFLLIITQLGCDSTAIVVCLVVTATMKCGFYGGSCTNNLDLAPNFAGFTSGILYTVINLTGIISPQVTGVLTKGQQTLTKWHTVFYITMAVCVTPYITYLVFGSAEEQKWNKPQQKKQDNRQIEEPA